MSNEHEQQMHENHEPASQSEEELSQAEQSERAQDEASSEQVSADNDNNNELEQLSKENQALKEQFLRAKAEVENITRRTQNELSNVRKFAIEGFAKELLSVLDSLDQAAKVELPDSEDEIVMAAVGNMRDGLQLTNQQLEKVMQKFGLTEVEAAAGVKFDPELHQAISMVPGGEIESGHIIDVMQKGYCLNERLIRPAMVVVAQ